MILPVIAGILIVTSVLWEAFEAVVLPRRATRRFRITRLFYRSTWIPWRAIAHRIRPTKTRETFLSFYGPLSILFLFVCWAIGLVFGFGLLYYSASRGESSPPSFITCLYLSGGTFFTLGVGDVTPHNWHERWLVVSESGLGFGFFALVFSYLPVIYQAFSVREVNIVLLDARARRPPPLRCFAGTRARTEWTRSSSSCTIGNAPRRKFSRATFRILPCRISARSITMNPGSPRSRRFSIPARCCSPVSKILARARPASRSR
jgi:hypothetical protein